VAFDCGADPSGGELGAICEVNVDGTGFRVLRTSAGILNLHSPSYAPDGTIVGVKVVRSSGFKSWDDAVVKALTKTETLPRDTDGRVPATLVISFRPKD
jgi:TonB family protein